MTHTMTPTPVLAWYDGSVSVGTDHLRTALQYEEPEPFVVYLSGPGGVLTEVDVKQTQGRFDDDDYACVTVRLVPKGSEESRLTFTYTVDGRA